jgi:hypothetical protein
MLPDGAEPVGGDADGTLEAAGLDAEEAEEAPGETDSPEPLGSDELGVEVLGLPEGSCGLGMGLGKRSYQRPKAPAVLDCLRLVASRARSRLKTCMMRSGSWSRKSCLIEKWLP